MAQHVLDSGYILTICNTAVSFIATTHPLLCRICHHCDFPPSPPAVLTLTCLWRSGGVTRTAAPSSLTQLPAIAGLKIFVFVLGVCFLGSAIVYGFYLLLQLGSGRLMLGIRLIRTAQAALREINYTGGLPLVTCGWLFALGLYAYVAGELAYPSSVVK